MAARTSHISEQDKMSSISNDVQSPREILNIIGLLLVWSWSHNQGGFSGEKSESILLGLVLRAIIGIGCEHPIWIGCEQTGIKTCRYVIGLVVLVCHEISLRTRRCHVGS